MTQGIVFDYSSVFPANEFTTVSQIKQFAADHGVHESNLVVIANGGQQNPSLWPNAHWRTTTAMPANAPQLANEEIQRMANEGRVSGIFLLSHSREVLAIANQASLPNMPLVPRHLKMFDTPDRPKPASPTGWRFDAIASEEEAVQTMIDCLAAAGARDQKSGLFSTEIRPLMRGRDPRWAGKSSVDGTLGLMRTLLQIAAHRGLIEVGQGTHPSNPVVWLTQAGIKLAAEPGRQAKPPAKASELASVPHQPAEAVSEVTTSKDESTKLGDFEAICRVKGLGPFSTVRLIAYECIENHAKAKPCSLTEIIFAGVESAGPIVAKRLGAAPDASLSDRRRAWPHVVEMLQRHLPRSEAVLSADEPISARWGASNKIVTGFKDEWKEHADGVIVMGIIEALGEFSEERLFDLAGLLHFRRDASSISRTIRIIELLIEGKKLVPGTNANGESVLRPATRSTADQRSSAEDQIEPPRDIRLAK